MGLEQDIKAICTFVIMLSFCVQQGDRKKMRKMKERMILLNVKLLKMQLLLTEKTYLPPP